MKEIAWKLLSTYREEIFSRTNFAKAKFTCYYLCRCVRRKGDSYEYWRGGKGTDTRIVRRASNYCQQAVNNLRSDTIYIKQYYAQTGEQADGRDGQEDLWRTWDHYGAVFYLADIRSIGARNQIRERKHVPSWNDENATHFHHEMLLRNVKWFCKSWNDELCPSWNDATQHEMILQIMKWRALPVMKCCYATWNDFANHEMTACRHEMMPTASLNKICLL